MENSKKKRIVLIVLGLIVVAFIGYMIAGWLQDDVDVKEMSFDQFVTELRANSPQKIEIRTRDILAVYEDGRQIKTQRDNTNSVFESLAVFGVGFEDLSDTQWYFNNAKYQDEDHSQYWKIVAVIALIILFLIFFCFLATLGHLFNYIKSKNNTKAQDAEFLRLSVSTEKTNITWDNIAGAQEAVAALKEAAKVYSEPEKAAALGVRQRRGILLTGAPGTGKTLLARAMANAVDADFKQISASSFVRLYVGAGATRIRAFFESMGDRRTIAFIDEIDAVGQKRSPGEFNQEREQTLNELLNQMDGYSSRSNILVIAATNLPESLDPALMRQGRFDNIIRVSLPTYADRFDIFKIHLANKPSVDDVDESALWGLAKETEGMSGADIEGIVNEASIRALSTGSDVITIEHLNESANAIKSMGNIRNGKSDF